MDDLVTLSTGDCKDHLEKLEPTLNKLKVNGLKYNI